MGNLTIVELRRRVARDGILVPINEIKSACLSAYPKMKVFGLDREFRAVPHFLAKELLDFDLTDSQSYIPEFHDCDNFALELKVGLSRLGYTAVGALVDLQGKHAYNVLATREVIHEPLELHLIEPQSDREIKSQWLGKGHYIMEEGGILF